MSVINSRRFALTLGCSALAVAVGANAAHAGNLIHGDSLLVTTTTYENVGQVNGLVAGVTAIPGGTAVSNGDLNTVWNNSSVDGQFGVTSPLTVQDLSATTAKLLASETLPTNQIVTSFSSKSELGLSITRTSKGAVATFMGYAPGGAGYPPIAAGMLDVSNADSTSFVDPTNAASQFYKSKFTDYAFNRSVVAVNANGSFTVTPTLAYGGDNSRAAVLAPNGLYYTVGNSNSGTTTAPQLTTTTGLEVVTPGSTANSKMIDPTFNTFPTYQNFSKDKAGKTNNYRGITYYDGNLYFTKGSGSNGIDTVYTVSNPNGELPTSATADSATISILPGFPTDSAKQTGANFTPFGLFFAGPTTLYVADEGTGNATDAATNAGLEKWTLSNGKWSLDYTLQAGLIGNTYNVPGWNFGETTIGLRNLTGEVNADGTVTLWATTATTSGSGDNGADPNEIVKITDVLGDTALPGSESFSVFDGPVAGLRYGGVAFAAVPEPATWTMLLLGFAGLGFMGYRKRSALSLG
ncbi:MAG TPA: PEP-CTERM sorting domain-containing protein [Roseiarcus sp.]